MQLRLQRCVVGQTSGLPVAKPLVSLAAMERHPEDAFTGRPEACPLGASDGVRPLPLSPLFCG